MLRGSRREGLEPEEYLGDDLQRRLDGYFGPALRSRHARAGEAARLDYALTVAFLRYARHRAFGRIEGRDVEPAWRGGSKPGAMVQALASRLDDEGPRASAESVEAAHPISRRLLASLRDHERIAAAGGWPGIPDGPPLRRGDEGERVALLRRRLGLTATGERSDRFDGSVQAAVSEFQRRHGLAPTGAVEGQTLAALNVPVQESIRQLRVNLERARWLPAELGERYILVNIPEAVLRLVEGDSVTLSMRAVVGKVSRPTPMLADKVTSIVLNPSWNLPPIVVAEDVLARPSETSAYLKEREIRVLRGWGKEASEVDPDSVRWERLDAASMPYRFRMEPGPRNALGRVKFLFPNDEHVYIHDSPERSLYRKEQRFFSSGCVRVEEARDLGKRLLRGSGWDEERVERVIASGQETSIALSDPIPVYLVYFTAWVDQDGQTQFRPDLYGRDDLLAVLLEQGI